MNRKLQQGNFPLNFQGPQCKKYGLSLKKLVGAKMGWTSSICMQSLVGIGGHTVTTGEKQGEQTCVLFVSFVMLLKVGTARHNVQSFNRVFVG